MKRRSYALLIAALLTSCSTPSWKRGPSSAGGVLVFLPNQADKTLPDPGKQFDIKSMSDAAAIEDLRGFLLAHKADLAVREPAALELKATGVHGANGDVAVRFEQQLPHREGRVGGFEIPVSGAGVVALVKHGKLVSVNSSVEVPPSVSFYWKNPGFDLAGFSDYELKVLLAQLKNAKSSKEIVQYFAKAAADSRLTFDLAAFDKLDFPGQKAALRKFFGGFGPFTTYKAIIDLAQKHRLALVRYGDTWMYEVTGFFNLPVQFDMVIPTDQNARLELKNLRLLAHDMGFNLWTWPTFPNDPSSAQLLAQAGTENDFVDRSTSGGATLGIFMDAARYFKATFGWVGFDGSNDVAGVKIFKDASDPKYAQNAMWMWASGGQEGYFVVGANGSQLVNFDRSPATLGHEFGHAITNHTSALVYRSQTGGLNEHFSDIQGVSFKAWLAKKPFDYLIGEDIVAPSMKSTKTLLIALDIASTKLDTNDMLKHNVTTPALRNLYQPRESYFAQPESVAEASQYGYGPSCQPSVNNDNCGVHYLSGIPNRAASMIIDRLGFERTRNLFFRTNTMRLNAASDFQDYVRQLYQECVSAGELDANSECPVIIDSFQKVGVAYPDGNPVPQPPAPPQPPSQPPTQPPTQPTPPPTSPVLEFCGWVDVAQTGSGNVTLIDNKFDAAILVSKNYPTLTQGDFADIYNWRGNPHPCGCVWGSLSQAVNSKGTVFNFFLKVTKMKAGQPSDCVHDRLIFK